jgi:lysophospholipid acyltransferase (LPLAT)-like uncharacterized protein
MTWRVRVVNGDIVRPFLERKEPFIHVLWHGQLLPLLWMHRHRQVAIMISEHTDGEIIARVAGSLGFRAVRGSTSRGAARVLLEACREIESGVSVAITVDGPRGPAKSVAPGAVVISQRTGRAMIPTAASADRVWRLRSWDRFEIPKPFARVTLAYSDPIRVAAETVREATAQNQDVHDGIERATRYSREGM